jgi:dihydrofolate reductase
MRLTIHTFLSLDGVMQAPGGPEEDPSGEFTFGGWTFPYQDEAGGAAIVGWMSNADAFLLGRKTYDIFAAHWPHYDGADNPVAAVLNGRPKYVASRTLGEPEWALSSVLGDDIVAEVTLLKERPGGELQVHGSGQLAQTLIAHDLIDEYRLFIFPVHLGSGRRLFGEDTRPSALRLTSSMTTPMGVVISTYVPDGPVRTGSFADDASAA